MSSRRPSMLVEDSNFNDLISSELSSLKERLVSAHERVLSTSANPAGQETAKMPHHASQEAWMDNALLIARVNKSRNSARSSIGRQPSKSSNNSEPHGEGRIRKSGLLPAPPNFGGIRRTSKTGWAPGSPTLTSPMPSVSPSPSGFGGDISPVISLTQVVMPAHFPSDLVGVIASESASEGANPRPPSKSPMPLAYCSTVAVAGDDSEVRSVEGNDDAAAALPASVDSHGARAGKTVSITTGSHEPGDTHVDEDGQLSPRIAEPGSPSGDVGENLNFEVLPAWSKPRRTSGVEERLQSRRISRTSDPEALSRRGHPSLMSDKEMMKVLNGIVDGSMWSRLVIHPHSMLAVYWELLILSFLVHDVILAPLRVFDLTSLVLLNILAWLVRVGWLGDLILNCRMGYFRSDGVVERNSAKMLRRYATTWLWLDLFCVVCDWAASFMRQGSGERAASALNVVRIVRIVRVLRLRCLSGMANNFREQRRSELWWVAYSIFTNVLLLLVICHLIACGWYGVGRLSGEDSGQSWVGVHGLEQASFLDRYSWSLHWALGQFVGEVLFDAQSTLERGFAILALLFALLWSSVFISSITTTMTRFQIEAERQASDMSVLRRFLDTSGVSTSLAMRVWRNVESGIEATRRNVHEKDVDALQLISEPLLMELHFEVYFPVLRAHPLMMHYRDVNLSGMMNMCHSAMERVSMAAGDILFSDYEKPLWPRVFFVSSGQLTYEQDWEEPVALHRGAWVCEAVLWTQWMHVGMLRISSDATLVQLDAAKFNRVLSPFPTFHLTEYARHYVKLMNTRFENGQLTDLDIGGEGARAAADAVFL